jgi:NADPH:quinone reductase-like Zn-dependent oxidoreductase
VQHRYGGPDVLALEEIETPSPGKGEVLVRVAAAAVGAGDRHLMRGKPFLVRLAMGGITRPAVEILGVDVAGRVEAVGPGVEGLGPGDEVIGHLADHGFGGFAEYVCAPEEAFVTKPPETSFQEAAAFPGSSLPALQGLRDKGAIRAGSTVLINGASGGVGSFAVQIAKAFGAEVTGVCSAGAAELVRSLGADHVLDYARQDYTRTGPYDIILDAAVRRSILEPRRALTPDGTYVFVGGDTGPTIQMMILGPLLSMVGSPKMEFLLTKPTWEDLRFLRDMVAEGKLRPVLDRTYPLDQVPDALRHFEEGHPRGKIVITV